MLIHESQEQGPCGGCMIRASRLPHPQARTFYCSVQCASRCWQGVEDDLGTAPVELIGEIADRL
jgi:hypothetical protein